MSSTDKIINKMRKYKKKAISFRINEYLIEEMKTIAFRKGISQAKYMEGLLIVALNVNGKQRIKLDDMVRTWFK